MGRNFSATALCTSSTSSALHTEGRLVLAFTTIRSAMSRSADASTYTWQMPVPVSMQGTVAFSTQVRISPAPPRGISRSTSPLAVMISAALWWLISSVMLMISASPPAAVMPSFSAFTMA